MKFDMEFVILHILPLKPVLVVEELSLVQTMILLLKGVVCVYRRI